MESTKCLDDVISALVPDSGVGADNPLDVAILRAQHDASALNTVVEQHKELYQRMENRVKAAEDSVQRLTSQLMREREVFKAAVAANTAQSRRLRNLLSSSGAADVSTETYLRRRNEDLHKRVKRLIAANRTLRARAKLEELDPDTSVLVAEGDSSLVVAACLDCFSDLSCFLIGLSTGELDWNLSDETRVVVRDALKAADASRSADEIADSVARAAFQVPALPSEMSPKTQAAETRRMSPGASLAEVREATSKRKAPSSPVRGGVTASLPVNSRTLPLASRLDSRRVLDLSGAALQWASLAPPVTATPLGAPDASAAGGVSPSLPTTSLQKAQATLASQSSRSALSSDESVATIVLSDGEVEVEDLVVLLQWNRRFLVALTFSARKCGVAPSRKSAKSSSHKPVASAIGSRVGYFPGT
ncbi:unnamed protein product [Phytophthora fragariaefolia]|uniref:Unnamed protein product n=1 Tax=Phytophthora fragariaefolia TaxID=1490495 RepID=A0A9W6TSH6_9STRA|nr:unnamed protein product [Phytophthora fragariaefolia]